MADTDQNRENVVLKRMLDTKPTPHKAKRGKKPEVEKLILQVQENSTASMKSQST